MKIIALLRTDLTAPATAATEARIVPDSALLLPGRPLFVPDLGSGWQAQPVVALHIGRLGRDIAPKFAPRYVDGVTVGLWLRLPAPDASLSAGLLDALDSTLALGRRLEVPSSPIEIVTPAASLTVDFAAEIRAAVAAVSRYATLKMGDVILTAAAGPPVDLVPGTRLEARAGADEVLSVKIL